MFDELTIHDARPILWLKRVFVFVVVMLLMVDAINCCTFLNDIEARYTMGLIHPIK